MAERKSIFPDTSGEIEPQSQKQWNWGRTLPSNSPDEPRPVIEHLRLAERKSRNRAWESRAQNRPVVFRRVPDELRTAVREVAEDLDVRADDVARAFLEYGLLCFQRGQLRIEPVLSEGRRTLFPVGNGKQKNTAAGWREGDGKKRQHPKSKKKSSQFETRKEALWKSQASYRGIPISVQEALRQIHTERYVPLGEVAALLLGYSLKAYQTGLLILTAVPRREAGLAFIEGEA